MSIDKIRHYMSEDLFNFWATVNDIDRLTAARDILKGEIEAGLLTHIKYHAELQLLNLKIGKP